MALPPSVSARPCKRSRREVILAIKTFLAIAVTSVAAVPPHWHAPRWWLPQAVCIHEHEGAWNSVGYVRGVPTYGGGMQFLPSTWASVGGGNMSVYQIAKTTPREQLYRAWLLYLRDHHSWREWGTAGKCGLR